MNTTLYTEMSLTELVNSFPQAAAVFDRRGIDYCCGGGRTLESAVGREAATDILREIDSGEGNTSDWLQLDIPDLIDHIRATHHRYTREQLKEIDALSVRVLQAHFAAHAETLLKVHRLSGELNLELEEHLIQEEELLFPLIHEVLAAGDEAARGRLEEQIEATDEEHEAAGELLRRLEEATGGYTPPGDACASFAELYLRLKNLAADIVRHVHKENTLFVRLRQLR